MTNGEQGQNKKKLEGLFHIVQNQESVLLGCLLHTTRQGLSWQWQFHQQWRLELGQQLELMEREGGLTFQDVLGSSSEKVQGKLLPRLQKQWLLPARAAKMVLGSSLKPREKTKEGFCLVLALRTWPRQLSWQPREKQESEHSVPVPVF